MGGNDKIFVEAYPDLEDNNPSEVRIYNGSKKTLVTLTKAAAASIPTSTGYEIERIVSSEEPTGTTSPDEATVIWENFLLAENYSTYTEGWDITSLEYVIVDLNKDTIPELLIQSSVDAPFYNTWLFVLNGMDIMLSNETYGYGSFRYSPSNNALIGSPEFRPVAGTGYFPFYSLCGTQLEYIFLIGQDEGRSYYSDSMGTKSISDEERSAYYADAIYFEWTLIQSQISTIGNSETDILNILLGDWTDGYTEYRFFADETFEENSVFFSSVNRQRINSSNIQKGVIEVTGINTADLAPYVQPNALQPWMELIYDSQTDTVYVGNTSHPYYRENVWMSGNIPEVNTPPVIETATGNTYGDNVSWTIIDGMLRATGVGKMENYVKAGYVPWHDERGKVTSVIMESGITTVGSYTFDGFGKLTSVALSDTIRSIEEFAFWRCDDLPSIVIPSGCTTIKNSAFNWCESLEYIVLPTSVTEIMWNAFANCDNLYDVYYSGTEDQWQRIDISGIGNEALTSATIHYSSNGPS